MKDLKIHLIAIGVICLVVTVIFFALGGNHAKQDGPAKPRPGDRQVQIYTATWGANCNDEMDRLMADPSLIPPPADGKAAPTAPVRFTKVQPNNVLERVGQLCNQRFTCELRADSQVLGVEPIDVCYKDLVIMYRCDPYDRPFTLTIPQGDVQTLDCLKPAPAANAPAPAQ